MNNNIFKTSGLTSQQFAQSLPSYSDSFDVTYNDYTSANLTQNLFDFDD
jgi:hypothetical protein